MNLLFISGITRRLSRMPVNTGADTQYHRRCHTFTLFPFAHLHLGHNILQRCYFRCTCCTHSRRRMRSARAWLHSSPTQLRVRRHAKWHSVQKKNVQMGRDRFFGGARAADLKSHPSVLRLTIWTSEITWARACQAGSAAEILAGPTSKGKVHEIGLLEDCVQEKKNWPIY